MYHGTERGLSEYLSIDAYGCNSGKFEEKACSLFVWCLQEYQTFHPKINFPVNQV